MSALACDYHYTGDPLDGAPCTCDRHDSNGKEDEHLQSLQDLPGGNADTRQVDTASLALAEERVIYDTGKGDIPDDGRHFGDVHGHVVEHCVVGTRGDGQLGRLALEGLADEARDEG